MSIHDRSRGRVFSRHRLIDVPQIETAALRAASPYLLNQMGSPLIPGCTDATQQPWAPGEVQPFPSTAVGLIAALGATGVILPANVLAIYQCDTATPLVDSLGLGPNLVAAGGPLTGRECVGLPTATFNSKVGCELTNGAGMGFRQAVANGFCQPNGGVISSLVVARCNTNATAPWWRALSTEPGAATDYWYLVASSAGTFILLNAGAGLIGPLAGIATLNDGAWHCLAMVIDDVGKNAYLRSDIADAQSLAAWAGNIFDAAGRFAVGDPGGVGASPLQIAYLACFDVALTSAQRTTFWRAYNPAALGTPNTYARLNPLVCPISASRVACYAGGNVGQLAVGYSAGFLTDGNAGRTGVCFEDGATFEPCGSTDLPGNAADSGGNTHSTVDGANGMRSGVRAVQTTNPWQVPPTARLCYVGPIALAGATNVPFLYGCWYRRATVGTTARTGMTFVGDPGGREDFNSLVDNASPVDWAPSQLVVTPIRAAHATCYMSFGASAVGDNCDFSELFLIRNRSTPVLGWRAVGLAVAAAVTSTPTLSMTNVGNTRYSPIRGMIELVISGFQGTNGATFLDFDIGLAGGLGLDYNAGQLRLRGWDSAAALAYTVLCGALGTGNYRLRISWDCRYPVSGAGGAYVIVEQINVGASPTVLGTWMGPAWNPPTADVAPLYVGSLAAGTGSARCFVQLA